MDESIKRILDGLEKVAPGAWSSAVHFTETDARVDLCLCALLLSLSVVLLRWALVRELDNFGEPTVPAIVAGAVAGILIIVSLMSGSNSISTLINPEGRLITRILYFQRSK